MGLYCHTGTITKYLPGLLADGVGAGSRNYSNGDSGRGECLSSQVIFPSLQRAAKVKHPELIFSETARGLVERPRPGPELLLNHTCL